MIRVSLTLNTAISVATVLYTSYSATTHVLHGEYGAAVFTVAVGTLGAALGAVRAAWSVERAWVGIGATGKIGEAFLRQLGGLSQQGFKTSLGWRYIDQLVSGIAHESKVGAAFLTKVIEKQILKDMELLATGRIQGSVWHFFVSPVTGLGGPSQALISALNAAGITFVIH